MQEAVTIAGIEISLWLYIPLVYLLWVFAWLRIKKVVFVIIRGLTKSTRTQLDDIFLRAIDFPLFLMIFSSGIIFVQKIYL